MAHAGREAGTAHVVATAGHVDHGKSTLVEALTGMATDRLAEERRRGLSIDLGFAWTRLPSGRTVAFVDVPGHRRFVGTMLAGVGAVPAVMFVVAADEGWMPQSQEHLAALDALRVRHGLLVVTRSDLADPEPARAEALEKLAASSLGAVEAVCVSAPAPARTGVDRLLPALDRLVAGIPRPRTEGPVRLWIDRSFSVRGAGTVVTGTLQAGRISLADRLEAAAAGRPVTVRGLQSMGQALPHVTAPARVAVNLRGVRAAELSRGDALVTPGTWLASRTVDVLLRGAPAGRLPGGLTLHVGSAAVAVRARRLGDASARLALAGPLPLRIGDAGLLRHPGAHDIAAGVTVLDVRPPALERRGAAGVRARELQGMDGTPDGRSEVRRRGLIRTGELTAMGADVPFAPVAGDWLADPARWAELRAELERLVGEHAREDPLAPGLTVADAGRRLGLPDAQLAAELVRAPLVVRDGRILAAAPDRQLPPAVRSAVDRLRRQLADAPFQAPDADRLHGLGLDDRALRAAVRTGALLRIDAGVYLLPGADAEAVRVLRALPQPFTVSQARQALGTSRRVAMPLLEMLARRGVTRRDADGRHHRVVG